MEHMLFLLEDPAGSAGGGGGGNFIKTILDNIADTVKSVGSYIVLILGVVLIIVSVVHIVKAFASRGSANWLLILGGLLVGGIMAFGGWDIITGSLSGLGRDTFDEAILEGNEPNSPGSVSDGTTGTTDGNTKHGLFVLYETFFEPFGNALALSVGAVLIALSMVQIYKYFAAQGRAQVSWLKTGAMLMLGLCLFLGTPNSSSAGGWGWLSETLSGMAKDATENIMDGNSTQEAAPLDDAGFSSTSGSSSSGSSSSGAGGF